MWDDDDGGGGGPFDGSMVHESTDQPLHPTTRPAQSQSPNPPLSPNRPPALALALLYSTHPSTIRERRFGCRFTCSRIAALSSSASAGPSMSTT